MHGHCHVSSLFATRPLFGDLSSSPSLARLRERLPVIIAHPHVSLPPSFVGCALRPGLWSLHGRTRQPGALNKFQRTTDDLVLHFHIPGLSTGIPKGKIHEQEARHATLLDDVPGGPDDNRWNAGGLEVSCDQTHGLVADGSKGNEKGNIDAILTHPCFDLRGVLFERQPLAVVRRDSVEPRAQ